MYLYRVLFQTSMKWLKVQQKIKKKCGISVKTGLNAFHKLEIISDSTRRRISQQEVSGEKS